MPSSRIPDKESDVFRLLTLNIAHGRKQTTHQALLAKHTVRRHLGEVARTVRGLSADVVALQEADGPSAWSGNFDHVELLAREARLADYFRGDHNPFRLGRFNLASGTALMARLPLSGKRSHRFGSSWRCTKGFVAATVEVPEWGGRQIDIVSLHLDFLAPKVRRQQIRRLADELGHHHCPRVILGDLNCSWQLEPHSMQLLVRHLGLRAFQPEIPAPTYPSHRPRFRLDWILISDELDFSTYQTVDVPLSDHLAVVADLRLR